METCMTPKAWEEFLTDLGTQKPEETLKEDAEDINKKVKGYRILQRRTNSVDEVGLKIVVGGGGEAGRVINEIMIRKIGDSWKVDETPM